MRRAGLLTVLAVALSAAPAHATTRYTSPTGTATSICAQTNPCTFAKAISSAAVGNDVAVAPGDYNIAPVGTTRAINVHGIAGQPRPRILGSSATAPTLNLAGGGSVSHLYVYNSAAGGGIDLTGVSADDLIVVAGDGYAIKVIGAATATLLRDSVARSLGTRAVTAQGSGSADLRNDTLYAEGSGSSALESLLTAGAITAANVVARGTSSDVSSSGASLTVSYSNFRPGLAPGVTDGGHNSGADPLFADAAGGDYHELAGSPTIDAGTTDALVGASDPDGVARVVGAAPDVGAFESTRAAPPLGGADATASGTTSSATGLGDLGTLGTTGSLGTPGTAGALGTLGAPGTPGALDTSSSSAATPGEAGAAATPAPHPQPGRSVALTPAGGRVLVRLPGQTAFLVLVGGAQVPVGAIVDARHGSLRLVSARDAGATPQTGTFSGGTFAVEQSAATKLVTRLRLAGGSFAACSAGAAKARTATIARRHGSHWKPRVIRQLWGRDHHGRYATDGRYASALVRGTTWLVQDRCDGTLVRVKAGAVLVHDRVRNVNVLVRAGRSYLARAPR